MGIAKEISIRNDRLLYKRTTPKSVYGNRRTENNNII